MFIFVDDLGDMYDMTSSLWTTVSLTLAIILCFYVLRSIGVMVITKKAGIKNNWLAFIPFAWIYVFAKLIKSPKIFSKPVEKYALISVIIFTVCELLRVGMYFLRIFPLFGYLLQGGNVYYVFDSSRIVVSGSVKYPLMNGIFTATQINIGYCYAEGMSTFFRVMSIVMIFVQIFELVYLAMMYSDVFRSYFPSRYVLATVLSVIGLFGPFIFAVRNNKPVDYITYMKERYARFYGYGNTYQNSDQGHGESDGKSKNEEPFGEYDNGNKTEHGGPAEPFSEFDDKEDKR